MSTGSTVVSRSSRHERIDSASARRDTHGEHGTQLRHRQRDRRPAARCRQHVAATTVRRHASRRAQRRRRRVASIHRTDSGGGGRLGRHMASPTGDRAVDARRAGLGQPRGGSSAASIRSVRGRCRRVLGAETEPTTSWITSRAHDGDRRTSGHRDRRRLPMHVGDENDHRPGGAADPAGTAGGGHRQCRPERCHGARRAGAATRRAAGERTRRGPTARPAARSTAVGSRCSSGASSPSSAALGCHVRRRRWSNASGGVTSRASTSSSAGRASSSRSSGGLGHSTPGERDRDAQRRNELIDLGLARVRVHLGARHRTAGVGGCHAAEPTGRILRGGAGLGVSVRGMAQTVTRGPVSGTRRVQRRSASRSSSTSTRPPSARST